MQVIRDVFRNFIIRDLRPLEDRDGVRIGEDVRIHKEAEKGGKTKYVLRFLKDTPERRKSPIRDRLEEHNIDFEEGPSFTV